MNTFQQSVNNLLLSQTDPTDFARLAPHLVQVELKLRQSLTEPGVAIDYAWFPITAVISVVATTIGGKQSEVALTGREGMIDVASINGAKSSPLEAFSQLAGLAWRIPVAELRAALAASGRLRALMLAYAQSYLIQVANTALVNASHTLEQRLARWLLMTHDRVESPDIAMTHQFLSLILGVRRAGVTMTVHKLEGLGLIKARRAMILIVDRAGLETVARDSYGQAEAEYVRLIGVDFRDASQPASGASYSSTEMRA